MHKMTLLVNKTWQNLKELNAFIYESITLEDIWTKHKTLTANLKFILFFKRLNSKF